MYIPPISFGKVITVSGSSGNILRLNNKVLNTKNRQPVLIQDVTSIYKNAPRTGILARAAEQGDTVNLYITGDDVSKVQKQQKGWHNTDYVLSHMTDYYSTSEMSVKQIARQILKWDKEGEDA